MLTVFAAWWFQLAHIPHNLHGYGHSIDFGLFALLSYIIWFPISMEVLSWAVAANIKDTKHRDPEAGLKVAFVTTYVPASESIDLLRKTLPAMVHASYAHDTWLLDEGNDLAARQLCLDLGVRHFSRAGKPQYNTEDGKFARKTKGGNHNSWYDTYGNDYDVVAQIDTDFIPSRSFLTRTLGHFKDPKVAFVGTPQIYGNTDTSMIARGAAQQTYGFYGPLLRGFYGMNSTLLIGANHVIRVAALKDVGHYSAHITEDLLTGMKLHARGWKSVYVHEPLAVGEGPDTWISYFNQQMRWAYGCIDILLHHSPKLLKQMNPRQATYYFFLQQHYFSGLAMMLSLLMLACYFLFGLNPANIPVADFLELYALALLACAFMALWLQRFNIIPEKERGLLLTSRVMSLASWPIFFLALVGVIRGKRLTYKVTPKGQHQLRENQHPVEFKTFRTHLAIGAACALLIPIGLLQGHASAVMLFWATLGFVSMSALPFALLAYAKLGSQGRRTSRFSTWIQSIRGSLPGATI